MKKKLLLTVFSFLFLSAFAQHRADNWYFGVLAGLDFSGGNPVALSGSAINTNEGCSSISDTNGALLFYTDGINVWNRNNQLMPNGIGLLGGTSSTQSALIVPDPASNDLYYIFTVDETGGPNGFRYSKVDMTLQSGMGDVSVLNILLQNTVTEKLAAMQQKSGPFYWIGVHAWGSDAFDMYHLTPSGLATTPVVSHTGIIHRNDSIQYTYGQMKFSPCGDKIAVAAGYLDTVEVFSFNDNTGVVSNPITLPFDYPVYGVEFSDDGNKLYVSNYDPSGTLVQYNLAAGNSAAIIASRTVLSGTPDIYGLQIGNDQKIYVCRSFSSWIGVINDPTLAGTACNYVDNGVDLDPQFTGATSALSLPGFVQSYFATSQSCLSTALNETDREEKNIIYPNPSTHDFTIHFSTEFRETEILIYDQAGNVMTQSVFSSPEIKYSFGKSWAPGIYFVRINEGDCFNVFKAVKMQQ